MSIRAEPLLPTIQRCHRRKYRGVLLFDNSSIENIETKIK